MKAILLLWTGGVLGASMGSLLGYVVCSLLFAEHEFEHAWVGCHGGWIGHALEGLWRLACIVTLTLICGVGGAIGGVMGGSRVIDGRLQLTRRTLILTVTLLSVCVVWSGVAFRAVPGQRASMARLAQLGADADTVRSTA